MFVLVFNDTATTEIYTYGHTLALRDALPISCITCSARSLGWPTSSRMRAPSSSPSKRGRVPAMGRVSTTSPRTETRRSGDALTTAQPSPANRRSEEHTSELQSLIRIPYAVFYL